MSRLPASSNPGVNAAASDLDAPEIQGALPAPPGEIRIGEAALLGVLGAGAGIAATIVRTKVAAHVLGSDGIGRAAEILNVVAIAGVPVAMFTGPALMKSVAEAARAGDHGAITRIVRTATTVVLVLSALALVLSLILGHLWLPDPWSTITWPLVVLAGAAALLNAWTAIPQQVLTAHTRLKHLTVVRLAIACIGAALACGGTYFFGLTGQFLALALAAVISLPFALRVTSRALAIPWTQARPAPLVRDLDRGFIRHAFVIGSSLLIQGYALHGATRAIYWALRRHGGADEIGQFTAAWTIGSTYFVILLDGIGTYVLPRYAAAQTESELAGEMDNAARFVFRVVPPALLAAIVLRGIAVHALYDHRFDGAVELVGLQMVADMCKAISWVQVNPLLYRNKVRAFLLVELSGWLTLALGAVLLVPRFGLLGVGYAYLGMNVGYTIFSAFLVARSCGVPFNVRRVGLTLLFTAAALAVLHLDRVFAATRWIVLAAAVVWLHRVGVIASVRRRIQARLDAVRGRSSPPETPST